MKYMSVGAVVPGRSRVVVEPWTATSDGGGWIALETYEFHFEYRGLEEAIASYIGRDSGTSVFAMRFSVQGVDESDKTVLGTWTMGSGYVGAV